MTREQEIEAQARIYVRPLNKLGIQTFIAGAMWADKHPKQLWKDAQGDDLPEIDREVIAITIKGKVVYAHRPNPDGFNCKSLETGKMEHFEPMLYDKGQWNQPDVKWWLDIVLPNLEEL